VEAPISGGTTPTSERTAEGVAPSRDSSITEVARSGTERWEGTKTVEEAKTKFGLTNGGAGKSEKEARGRELGKCVSEGANNEADALKFESKTSNGKAGSTKVEEESLEDEPERTNDKFTIGKDGDSGENLSGDGRRN
jgi:hypothetical protein